MNKETREKLVDRLMSFVEDEDNTDDKVIFEVLQAISSDISNAINPMSAMLVPFYIMEFEQISAVLRSQYPLDAKFADDLKQNISMTALSVEVPQE